jgi:hypothetical protein
METESVESAIEPDKEMEINGNGDGKWEIRVLLIDIDIVATNNLPEKNGTELEEATTSNVASSNVDKEETSVISSNVEEHNSASQPDDVPEINENPAEENVVLQPKPENPLLKAVAEVTPPTPRDSSPLQMVLDDHPISPTDRKEVEVQPPTSICEFPLVTKGDEPENIVEGEPTTNWANSSSELSAHDAENSTDRDEPSQETVEEEAPPSTAQKDCNESTEEEENNVKEPENVTQPQKSVVDKTPDHNDNEEEFELISKEDAPIDLAEKYPPTEEVFLCLRGLI